jgi:hypothetical protein
MRVSIVACLALGGAILEAQDSLEAELLGACRAEIRKRYGVVPRVHVPQGGLKRVSGADPSLAAIIPQGTRGSGGATHELLVGPDGRVHQAWALRVPTLDPPNEEYHLTFIKTFATWRYQPHEVDGKRVPACVVVTTAINWR